MGYSASLPCNNNMGVRMQPVDPAERLSCGQRLFQPFSLPHHSKLNGGHCWHGKSHYWNDLVLITRTCRRHPGKRDGSGHTQRAQVHGRGVALELRSSAAGVIVRICTYGVTKARALAGDTVGERILVASAVACRYYPASRQ